MSVWRKRFEWAKIRTLEILAEPSVADHGMTKTELEMKIKHDLSYCNVQIFPDMEAAGLISRRVDPGYAHAKPYAITEAGREYLERHRGDPEMAAMKDLVAKVHSSQDREIERASVPTFVSGPSLTVQAHGLPEPSRPTLKLWTGDEDTRRSKPKGDGPPDLPGR